MDGPVRIGWRERVGLPAWGIEAIEAKSDTGARSSAVDVKNLKFLNEAEDEVSFEVVLSRTDRAQTIPITTKVKRHSKVKSSNGHVSERVVVETEMELGGVRKKIDISLICRKPMQCRMLIGRTALSEDFLVDSSSTYLASEKPRKVRKKRVKKRRVKASEATEGEA